MPPGCHTFVQSPFTLYQPWSVSPVNYARDDGTSLTRLGYKGLFGFCLDCLLTSTPSYISFTDPLLWEKPSATSQIVIFYRKARKTNKGVRPPANVQESELGSTYTSPGRAFGWLQLQETWSWNHPAKPLLDSWLSETVWPKAVCGLWLLDFGVLCYAAKGD